jgi:hypothetical protein
VLFKIQIIIRILKMHANNTSGASSRFNPNGGSVLGGPLSFLGGSGGGSVSPAIGGSLPLEMMSQNGHPSAFNPMTAQ